MVGGENSFITVRFGYPSLPVSDALVSCREDGCILQSVNALVYLWQRVCIPYFYRVTLVVVDTETQFFVFLPCKHHRACLLGHCGLDHDFVECPVSLLTLAFYCLQPGPVQNLEC